MAFSWVLPGSNIFSRSCFNWEVYNESIKPISDSADGRKVKHYRSLMEHFWNLFTVFLLFCLT